MRPSPKLPTSSASRNLPKLRVATARPQGELSIPCDAKRRTRWPGNGFVDIFRPDGHLVRRFASHGMLNSPWGLAVATRSFGKFRDALLVGNFGDGRINAYNLRTGAFLGQLSDPHGRPIQIEGLWALGFGRDSDWGRDDDN